MPEAAPPNYGDVFHHCPDPLAILEGDQILSRNTAFQSQIGDTVTLLTCFHPDDHAEIPGPGVNGSSTFIARPAIGKYAGQRMRWTQWSAGNGQSCLRLDGRARAEIPAPLAPLFPKDEEPSLPTLLAGKMFERRDSVLWVIAKDGTMLLSEGSGLAHYQLKPGQLVGLNAFDVYPEGSMPRNDCETVLAGTPIEQDQLDGDIHWIRYLDPVRDAEGNVTALVGFAINAAHNTLETRQAKALIGAINEMPVAIWAMDPDGTCTLSVGKGVREFGFVPGQLVGSNLFEVYAQDAPSIKSIHRALAGEQVLYERTFGTQTWQNHYIPAYDSLGQKVLQLYGITENITVRAENEKRLQEQLALIQSQQQAIAELQSPIIEVWRGVLVVPVIGNLDSHRASRLLEHLLHEVVRRQSQSVILDLTGVDTVDETTAQNLFDIMRSVELLGATGLVSGIRPSVARTMVDLNISLTNRKTYPTLAEALRRLIGARQR